MTENTLLQHMSAFLNFWDYREHLVAQLLKREPGAAPNPFEQVEPEDYIDDPIQAIPLDQIANLPDTADTTKSGLEEFAKQGRQPDKGAFHGLRLGKQVQIPIAVKVNPDETFSITDGYHRAVQTFVNGQHSILAFTKGGAGQTLKDLWSKQHSDQPERSED